MNTKLLLFCSTNYHNEKFNKNLVNNEYNLFNEIKLLTENDLDPYITSIVKNNMKLYGYNYANRGYGYWLWKPYIILQELNNMEDNDILVHLDMHCKLNIVKDKFNDIINELNNQSIILGISGYNDLKYTTTKLRKQIELMLNYKFTNDQLLETQYESGIQFIKNCDFSRKFIKEWFDLMLNNQEYISDVHNNDDDNDISFVENRHDQSVISLLYKYYKLNTPSYLDWEIFHSK